MIFLFPSEFYKSSIPKIRKEWLRIKKALLGFQKRF